MHLTIIDETFLPPSSFWQTKAFLFSKKLMTMKVFNIHSKILYGNFQMDKIVKFVALVCLNDRMK